MQVSTISRSVAPSGAAQSAGNELAVEVPDRQAIRLNIEFGMILHRLPAKRIEIGDQMAANPISIDQFEHARLLSNHVAAALFAEYRRVDIHRPSIRPITNPRSAKISS